MDDLIETISFDLDVKEEAKPAEVREFNPLELVEEVELDEAKEEVERIEKYGFGKDPEEFDFGDFNLTSVFNPFNWHSVIMILVTILWLMSGRVGVRV